MEPRGERLYIRAQRCRQIQGSTSNAVYLEALNLQSSCSRNSNDWSISTPITTENATKFTTILNPPLQYAVKQERQRTKTERSLLHFIKIKNNKIIHHASCSTFLKVIFPWVLEGNKVKYLLLQKKTFGLYVYIFFK